MTALSKNRSIDQVASAASLVQCGVGASASVLFEGAMVCALTSGGYAVKAGTASTGAVLGVADAKVDNSSGSDGDKSVDLLAGLFWRPNYATHPCTQAHFGKVVYAKDDQTISSNSSDGPVAGVMCGLDTARGVLVLIMPGLNYLLSQATLESDLASTTNGYGASKIGVEDSAGNFTGADVEAVLAEIMTLFAGITGATGGNLVGYDDSGSATSAATLADALDEIYVDLTSSYKYKDIPFDASWFEVDGTALADFASGTTPGLETTLGIRWEHNANPDPITKRVPVPWDLDNSEDVIVSVIASKTGNTAGDATTFDIGVKNIVVGALYDADSNYGGTSAAMVGDATAKTVQAVELTLANANLPDPDAAHAVFEITFQPTDGTLGTDDLIAHALRLRYKRKLLTS